MFFYRDAMLSLASNAKSVLTVDQLSMSFSSFPAFLSYYMRIFIGLFLSVAYRFLLILFSMPQYHCVNFYAKHILYGASGPIALPGGIDAALLFFAKINKICIDIMILINYNNMRVFPLKRPCPALMRHVLIH